jgi:hypothetical protein
MKSLRIYTTYLLADVYHSMIQHYAWISGFVQSHETVPLKM